MRKIPFVSSANSQPQTTTADTATPESVPVRSLSDSVVDLTDLLSRPTMESATTEIATDTAPEITDENTAETAQTTDTTTGATDTEVKTEPKTDAPKFNVEDYNKFKENTTKVLGDYVKDPAKVTKVIVKFGSLIRSFVYPFIYKFLIFDSAMERTDIDDVLKKRATALKKNETPEFNNYEQMLWEKWEEFQGQKKKIAFTEDEVQLLSEIFQAKVSEMPIAQWIEKYDWLLILLYMESKRFIPVVGIRMKNNVMKEFDV